MRPASSAITFEAKTFDAEWITNARFAPDGQTIVFSAALTGEKPQLFVIRSGTVTSEPISDAGTHLLSVSSKGELAVLTDAHIPRHRLFTGTLAIMTMDGAPRPRMQGVTDADWSPDGLTLAILRTELDKTSLEYPIDHVLYQSTRGYLSDLRVSPDGARVAFFDHQFTNDDRGVVKVVGTRGTVTTLTPGTRRWKAWRGRRTATPCCSPDPLKVAVSFSRSWLT